MSEKGTRDQNEDSYLVISKDHFSLFVVADGLGGHAFGELASKIAIGELRESFQRKGQQGFLEGLMKANETIVRENERRNSNMGTTIVATLYDEENRECTIAHTGDSRAYIFNGGIWRTKDHSLVQSLVDKGEITNDEAFQHPQKNIITKSLGIKDEIEINFVKKIVKNTVLLLCSDGLSDYLKDEEISAIVLRNSPKEACKELVQKALANGGKDNITVIVINLRD